MKLSQRRIEFLHHLAERGGERGPPPDQHIVVAGTQPRGRRKSYDLPQPAPDAVTLHSVTHLPRYGEADPDRSVLGSRPRLQHECAGGSACAMSCGSKIAAAPQPLDDGRSAFPLTH